MIDLRFQHAKFRPLILWDPWDEKGRKLLSKPDMRREEWSVRQHLSYCSMATFASAIGAHFQEGMTLLDIGCGSSRFANFMSYHLKTFRYFGVETKESISNWQRLHEFMQRDPRISIGEINSDLEREAFEKATVVLALSVYTHLEPVEFKLALRSWQPILERGGRVVLSLFLGDDDELGPEKFPGYRRFVRYSRSTTEDLLSGVSWSIYGEWVARMVHQIFVLENSK